MGRDHLLVEPIDQRRSQVFRARSARVAALAFLETATHRRLAAADLADGFRVSLRVPCHTIDSAGKLRARYWLEGTFRRGRVQKEFFTLSFPERQGKGGAALLPSLAPSASPPPARLSWPPFLKGSPATGKEQRDLAPGEHADEV
jgi:hypothetical protein